MPLTHPFMQHVLSTYYVPGTVRNTSDVMETSWDLLLIYLFVNMLDKWMAHKTFFCPVAPSGHLSPTSCWPLIVLDHASFLSPSPRCNRKIFLYILFNFSTCAEHTGAKRNTSITMKLCRWGYIKKKRRPPALCLVWMLQTVGIRPEGWEVWAYASCLYHLSTLEADALSGVAKRTKHRWMMA